MAAVYEIKLEELASWTQRFADQYRAIDWSRTAAVLAVLLVSWVKQNFERGQSPDGKQWEPLRWPRSHGRGGDKPLRDKGLLMASISAMQQIKPGGFAIKTGSPLIYSRIHQEGGKITIPAQERDKPFVFKTRDGATVFTRKIKERTIQIPARPYLGLSEEQKQRVQMMVLETIKTQMLGKQKP
jgi:phage virion morphogenesis protein